MNNPKYDNVESLNKLGNNTQYTFEGPSSSILETFPNNNPERDYNIELIFPEFTSNCPKTGQPDFAEIVINYIPDKLCVESKSLKLYYFSYRNEGAFMETIANKILTDFVEACHPRKASITAYFNARGGLRINPTITYEATK